MAGSVNAFAQIQEEINSLYEQLTNSNPPLTPQQSQQVIAEISALVSVEEAIINDSLSVAADYSTAADMAAGALGDQQNATQVMQAQLQASQELLQQTEAASLNQIRMIEINDYYGTVYYEYAHIMQIVVILCVHLCVLMLLYKYGLLPKVIFIICMAGSISVGLLYILKNWYYTVNRDPMDAQAYFFTPPPNSSSSSSSSSSTTTAPS